MIVVFILYLRGKRWSSKATDSEIPAGGGAFRSSTDIRNKKMSVMQTIAAGTRSQQRKSRGETPDSDCISNEFIPAKAAAKKSSLSILAMTRPPSGPTPSSPLPKASKDAPLKMVVIDSYRAGLADELNLSVNDKIVCEEVFDDGIYAPKTNLKPRLGTRKECDDRGDRCFPVVNLHSGRCR